MNCLRKSCRQATAAALVFLLAGTAQAQLSTATIRGKVTSEGAPAPAGLKVVAVNKESGFDYRTVTLQDGSYTVSADVSDAAGDAADQAAHDLKVDQTPPTVVKTGMTRSCVTTL